MKTGILLPHGAFLFHNPQLVGTIVTYEEDPHAFPKRARLVFLQGMPIMKNALLAGKTAHIQWCPEHVARTIRKFLAYVAL
jgi:hypothetical protein